MPWKGEKDPYRIWISEIILQQTRVDQGLAYYNRFIQAFPTIQKLAAAPDEKVLKLWEGLGYYSRCRNLISTARTIVKEYKGRFPDTYAEILALKGVGPYTAAAIASFAFGLPHAVVDGNVFRVLSRYFGIQTETDSTAGKKLFTVLAGELLDPRQPGVNNQAIMDFGAVVCKPAAPLCTTCPLQKKCKAFTGNRVHELPVKAKKISIRKRWFTFMVIRCNDSLAIRKRTGQDIWKDLFEFPAIETTRQLTGAQVLADRRLQQWIGGKQVAITETTRLEQLLSHQRIYGQFILLQLKTKPPGEADWIWVKQRALKNYPFPGLLNRFLELPEAGRR